MLLLHFFGGASMTDPSIVAIIPLYNGARWIEQSIRSVFAQTLQPDEFIVVDDGSTDGDEGAAIVERLAKERPVMLLHKPNGGQSSARNFGVAHARSTLIALLDQDDVWYPHHLERLVRPFRVESGMPLGWAYSDLDEIDESGGLVHRNFHQFIPLITGRPTIHPKTSLADCLSHDMFILPSASLISRAAFDGVGGFDEQLCGYEDDDLFLRLFRAGWRSVYISEALSQWRIYPGSTSYSPRMAKSRMIYARKLLDNFPDNRRQNRYFASHCIAPRFMRSCLANFAAALEHRDADLFQMALSHAGQLFPHLSIKRRLLMLAIMACAMTGIIHAAYGSRDFIRPIAAQIVR
jgi:glycosyltransferase involved in cell wall biosynthesis